MLPRLAVVAVAFVALLASGEARAHETRLLEASLESPVAAAARDVGFSIFSASEGGITPCILTIIPGLGQVFNGQILKGIFVFGVVAILGGSRFATGGSAAGNLLSLGAGLVWILAFVDAFKGGGIIPIGDGGDVGPGDDQRRQVLNADFTRPIER